MDMELAISLVPAIEQVLVIGEGESFLAAIAVLDRDEWRHLAERFKLDADDAASLNNERLQSFLLNEIKGRLKDFPGYAKVRRIILSLEPWTVDNGLLTPTLKVKRARVLDKFAEEIRTLYESGPVGR
jgi:long-chain acyl-CoA synthetase